MSLTETKSRKPAYISVPYTVAVDSREQHPYIFRGYFADEKYGRLPLVIPIQVIGLKSGDYSILGMEDRISVERKSLADLYGTLSAGRKRFEAEMSRLASLECAAVVIEASLSDLIHSPPSRSKVSPKVIYRTWISWQHRWRVPWHLCDSRALAERTTFRILDWFWNEDRKINGRKHEID